MIPQGFIDYHQMRDARIRTKIQRLRIFCSVDDVHDLRVEIKRLRAFYFLIDWIDRDFQARRHLRAADSVFKGAGPLRDLQVQMALTRQWSAENNGNLSEYYGSLALQAKRRRSSCGSAARRFDPGAIPAGLLAVRKALGKYVEPEVVYRAEQRLAVLVRDLLVSGGNDISEKALHDIRIQTKEARYVLEVLSQCRFGSEQDTELNKGLLECHRALGKWHDCLVLADNVQRYMADRPADFYFDRDSYTRFLDSLSAQREDHLQRFRQHWANSKELFLAISKKIDAL